MIWMQVLDSTLARRLPPCPTTGVAGIKEISMSGTLPPSTLLSLVSIGDFYFLSSPTSTSPPLLLYYRLLPRLIVTSVTRISFLILSSSCIDIGAGVSIYFEHIPVFTIMPDRNHLQAPSPAVLPHGAEVSRPRKKIILCFDGTGNKFKGNEGDTNILKIFRMLDRSGSEQCTFLPSSSARL